MTIRFLETRLYPVLMFLVFLASCLSPRPGTTRLAATPLGFGSDLSAQRLSQISHREEDIPVFIVSSRHLLTKPKGVNPFGDDRADSPVPHLAVAKVGVGKGPSNEEIVADTLNESGRKGKTRFTLKEVDLIPPPSVDHFQITAEGKRFCDHGWIQKLNQVGSIRSRKGLWEVV